MQMVKTWYNFYTTYISVDFAYHELVRAKCIYAKNPPLYVHAGVSSRARGMNFGRSSYLYLNIVSTSSKGSDETVLSLA